jgi:hypothetical protein
LINKSSFIESFQNRSEEEGERVLHLTRLHSLFERKPTNFMRALERILDGWKPHEKDPR